MKILNFIIGLFTILTFGQGSINLESSFIKWTGEKITGETHYGTLKFISGKLDFSSDKINGGEFVVDMNSLSVDDLTGRGKASLEGHLVSDDFFSVDKHSTASLVILSAKKESNGSFRAKGNLEIKGITNEVVVIFIPASEKMTAKLIFDRSKFNVRYGSDSFFNNLGNRLILNDVVLEVSLSF
jgi:polyisoprenoid-binding protein YceI